MRVELFFASMTTWAICWLTVMWVYGLATHSSWRESGGQWRNAPGECYGFFRWFLWNVWQDFRHGFTPYPEEMPQLYSAGHLLRLFITASAFVCGLLGIVSANIDRSAWPLWLVTAIFTAVLTSILAALGQLSVAWRLNPRRWRMFVMAISAWAVIAFWLR